MIGLVALIQVVSGLELAFGSCSGMFGATNPEIWKSIKRLQPEAFIWLGDAIYADVMIFPMVFRVPSEELWKSKYVNAKMAEGYRDLINTTRILGIWDDHDYGNNDENRYFAYKKLSKKLFLEFLDEPLDSIRYQQEGLYISYDFLAGALTVKVILLDDRTNMDPWGPEGDTLGQLQWEWLESQLNTPADLFIITNGIQINVEDRLSITEKWHENSRKKLLKLLKSHPNTILITGDVHYSEILEIPCNGNSLIELTTSGLTHSIHTNYGFLSNLFITLWYPYTYNITPRKFVKNFGTVTVTKNGEIELKVRDSGGEMILEYRTSLNDLNSEKNIKGESCEIHVRKRQILHLASVFVVFFLPVSIWLQVFLRFFKKYSNMPDSYQEN